MLDSVTINSGHAEETGISGNQIDAVGVFRFTTADK
jgi:hypothetical protein